MIMRDYIIHIDRSGRERDIKIVNMGIETRDLALRLTPNRLML